MPASRSSLWATASADVPRPLDGYGYLVTRREQMTTLGVAWESSLFPGRAPEGHVLLRAMLGGERTPAAVAAGDTDCVAVARRELTTVLGIAAEPVHVSIVRWPQAIAQYTVGHDLRRERSRHARGRASGAASVRHVVRRCVVQSRRQVRPHYGARPRHHLVEARRCRRGA